jgi:hypothetical protein
MSWPNNRSPGRSLDQNGRKGKGRLSIVDQRSPAVDGALFGLRSDLQPAGLLQIRPAAISYFFSSGQSLASSGFAASSGEIVATSL